MASEWDQFKPVETGDKSDDWSQFAPVAPAKSEWDEFKPAIITQPGEVTVYTPGQGNRRMEGGWETSSGKPMHSLEMWQRGETDFVTAASRPGSPLFGQRLNLTLGSGEEVPVEVTDTGPGVHTLDIASEKGPWATNAPPIFDETTISQTGESALEGLTEPGNIDLTSEHPFVRNEDGTFSSVKSIGISENGEEVVIPTVAEGIQLSEDQARARYRATGKHLGKFSSEEAASMYAQALHQQEESRIPSGLEIAPPEEQDGELPPAANLEQLFPGQEIRPETQEGAINFARVQAGQALERFLAPTTEGKPIIPVEAARGALSVNPITALSQVFGPTQRIESGVRQGLAELVSGLSTPEIAASLPAYALIPGLGEAFVAQQLLQAPETIGHLKDIGRKYGWTSPQFANELTKAAVMTLLPIKGLKKGFREAAVKSAVKRIREGVKRPEEIMRPAEIPRPSETLNVPTTETMAPEAAPIPTETAEVAKPVSTDLTTPTVESGRVVESHPRVTGTANAVVDAERIERGLQPIYNDAVQTHPALMAEAERLLADNPGYGESLVSSLLTGEKNTISPLDEAVLLREKITAQNQRGRAAEIGLDADRSSSERSQAQQSFEQWESYINKIDQATRRSGQIWGQFGRFRQRLARDDYSLVSVEQRARVGKGGKPLSAEESASLERDVKRIEKAQKQLDDKINELVTGEGDLTTKQSKQIAKANRQLQKAVDKLDPIQRLHNDLVTRYQQLENQIARMKGLVEPTRRPLRAQVEDHDIQILQTELDRLKAVRRERAALNRMNENLDRRIARLKGLTPKEERALAPKIEGDLETENLQTELNRVKALQKEERAKRAKANRLDATRERLERTIAQIKGLEPRPPTMRSPALADAEIEALRTELARLRLAERTENRLPQAKERTRKRIDVLEKRMQDYGFAKETPRERIVPDPELRQLQYRLARTKADIDEGIMNIRFKNQNAWEKTKRLTHEVYSIPRQIMASSDLSALRRQGGMFFMSRPLTTLNAFARTLRAYSKEGFDRSTRELQERDNAWKYDAYNVGLTEYNPNVGLIRQEEMAQSRWGMKIPVVAQSNRVYTAFLNRLRADVFDQMEAKLARYGEVTPLQGKALGNFIRVWTGRGSISERHGSLVMLNDFFFAPRYAISRFEAVLGQPLLKGDFRVKKMIAWEYAKLLTGYGITYGTISMFAPQSVQWDPRSSDFGKAKMGNTRLDLMSGLAQATTFLARNAAIATAKVTDNPDIAIDPATGRELKFGNSLVFFGRSKLAPLPSSVWNQMEGKNLVGEPVTLGSEALSLVSPLSWRELQDTIQEQGVPAGAALTLLSIFGDSLQTYSPNIQVTMPKDHRGPTLYRPSIQPRKYTPPAF